MIPKPSVITRIGIVQTILASAFVVWLIFFPGTADNFAWPIVPEQSAMFIGAGFIMRAFLGFRLWREKYWHRLRWQVWGNYAFLTIILLGTLWHVEQMNWSSNIWVAHVWVLAYIIEPLTLPLFEPRGEAAGAPFPAEELAGPILVGLRRVLLVGFVFGVALGLLFFINPAFMDTRWPWSLDPFDARIMAAFPIMGGFYALWGYRGADWAEIRQGVFSIMMFLAAFIGIWLYNVPQLDFERNNVEESVIIAALFVVLLGYYTYRQEKARRER